MTQAQEFAGDAHAGRFRLRAVRHMVRMRPGTMRARKRAIHLYEAKWLVAEISPRWNRVAEWLSRVRHFENA